MINIYPFYRPDFSACGELSFIETFLVSVRTEKNSYVRLRDKSKTFDSFFYPLSIIREVGCTRQSNRSSLACGPM